MNFDQNADSQHSPASMGAPASILSIHIVHLKTFPDYVEEGVEICTILLQIHYGRDKGFYQVWQDRFNILLVHLPLITSQEGMFGTVARPWLPIGTLSKSTRKG
jgi:hypothetical protein